MTFLNNPAGESNHFRFLGLIFSPARVRLLQPHASAILHRINKEWIDISTWCRVKCFIKSKKISPQVYALSRLNHEADHGQVLKSFASMFGEHGYGQTSRLRVNTRKYYKNFINLDQKHQLIVSRKAGNLFDKREVTKVEFVPKHWKVTLFLRNMRLFCTGIHASNKTSIWFSM